MGRTAIIVSITAIGVVGTLVAVDAWYGNSCIRWGKQVCASHQVFKTFVRKYRNN